MAASSSRPYCYLEHVKSCQACKLAGMEDLCRFKPVRINDSALTQQKPPARLKGYSPDFWVKNATRGMLLSRDRSKFLGYYIPESVQEALEEGIRIAAWEYRAYKEDPETPRRIYAGDDANIRESELDHYKDGGYAEDEDGSPELVTPYDAGLDPEEDIPDPENADLSHTGGFVPAFIFRTTHRDRKVLMWEPFETTRLPGTWMGFKVTMFYKHSPGKPFYRWETVPTLKPVGCKVDLVDGYVVPRGRYVRLSTIKTRADRKRSRDRAELGRQRRAYTGFLIKKDAVEARIGRPLPELPLRRQVARATC